jgi:hypothetical protein
MILSIIFRHLIFFLVGVFQDLFITYYYQSISKEHAWKAGFLSTLVTIINLVILYQILNGIGNEIMSIVLAYAIGNGVGTVIIIKKHLIKNILKKYFKQIA